MENTYILYHPAAGVGKARERAQTLAREGRLLDVTCIRDWQVFLDSLTPRDKVILCGGDGTINCFVNRLEGPPPCPVFYEPAGTGNDLARELQTGDARVELTQLLQNLPRVWVDGQCRRFVNAVGYGIDGWCCVEGDRLRARGKRPNYTAIAIRGLLKGYRPTAATVTVDEKVYRFDRVWLAPLVHGKYYGGGMMPAPEQKRGSGQLSVMLMHGAGKLRTLIAFPGIFSGKHIQHRCVTVLSGQQITVRFDEPRPVQIDGEVITDVRCCRVQA